MDQQLRQAERSGDPARLLAVRLRSGLVPRENVKWAAALGHQAARKLVGPEGFPSIREFSQYGTGLAGTARAALSLIGRPEAVLWACEVLESSPEWDKIKLISLDRMDVSIVRIARLYSDCPADIVSEVRSWAEDPNRNRKGDVRNWASRTAQYAVEHFGQTWDRAHLMLAERLLHKKG